MTTMRPMRMESLAQLCLSLCAVGLTMLATGATEAPVSSDESATQVGGPPLLYLVRCCNRVRGDG